MAEAIVCGAGAAGLAAGATLRAAGVEAFVLERCDRVAASWRTRHRALRLNTPGWMCTLPGYRARRRQYGEFPSRDQWIRYLEDYATHHRLDVRFGTDVRRITRGDRDWEIQTADGTLNAPIVVIATGFDREPHIPEWPGRAGFTGELIHSSAYIDADPYRGRDVLVVGPGVSGTEIAHLVREGGAARVRVAVRTPPHFYQRKWLGIPAQVPGIAVKRLPIRIADEAAWWSERAIFGDLSCYGLPRPSTGVATQLRDKDQAPACDDGFVRSVKAGRIEIVPAVEGFDGSEVLLADGSRIRVDSVIAATGYLRGLDPLVGHLGVLDGRGRPVVHGAGQHPYAPGLFFTGFRADLSGQMRLMRFDARAIGRAVATQRRTQAAGKPRSVKGPAGALGRSVMSGARSRR